MHNYDFTNLDPLEFEALANDLIASEFKTQVERFKPGKDLGIDGRFFQEKNNSGIIQSKHYAISGFNALLHDLKKHEIPKILKIKPTRYIILTSVPLSPLDKQKIHSAASPYIISTLDIFGKEDINALIANHDKIERNHFKLWISSSTILRKFINSAVYTASSEVVSDALEKNKHYIVTTSHIEASNKIVSTNVVVITGEPGIGKTSLAEQLCLDSVADGYELIAIQNNIEEAYSVYEHSEKQIFYFDDFLGRNFLETLRFNEDSRIMRFIDLIKKSKNKRFILTSRTNILDQGYVVGQAFSINKLKINEYMLNISNYSQLDKARILYSFMWKSNLGVHYLTEIISGKKYKDIVSHRNFNPRIIEFITSNEHCESISPADYVSYIDHSLNNPKDVWDHPYSTQLDDLSRSMVDFVVLSNGTIEENKLKTAYHNFSTNAQYVHKTNISRDFNSIVRTLSRSFLKKTIIQSLKYDPDTMKTLYTTETTYSTFNPSISDYVLDNKFIPNPHLFADMILYFGDFEGIAMLENLKFSNTNTVTTVSKLIIEQLSIGLANKSFSFVTRLGNLLDQDTFSLAFTNISLDYFNSGAKTIVDEHVLTFFDRLSRSKDINPDDLSSTFAMLIQNINSYSDLETVSSILEFHELSTENKNLIATAFYPKLLSLWTEDIAYEFINDKIGDFATRDVTYEDDEGNVDYEFDVDIDSLANAVCDYTNDLFCSILFQDALSILSHHDLQDIAKDYFENLDSDKHSVRNIHTETLDIEEIFTGFIQTKFTTS